MKKKKKKKIVATRDVATFRSAFQTLRPDPTKSREVGERRGKKKKHQNAQKQQLETKKKAKNQHPKITKPDTDEPLRATLRRNPDAAEFLSCGRHTSLESLLHVLRLRPGRVGAARHTGAVRARSAAPAPFKEAASPHPCAGQLQLSSAELEALPGRPPHPLPSPTLRWPIRPRTRQEMGAGARRRPAAQPVASRPSPRSSRRRLRRGSPAAPTCAPRGTPAAEGALWRPLCAGRGWRRAGTAAGPGAARQSGTGTGTGARGCCAAERGLAGRAGQPRRGAAGASLPLRRYSHWKTRGRATSPGDPRGDRCPERSSPSAPREYRVCAQPASPRTVPDMCPRMASVLLHAQKHSCRQLASVIGLSGDTLCPPVCPAPFHLHIQ